MTLPSKILPTNAHQETSSPTDVSDVFAQDHSTVLGATLSGGPSQKCEWLFRLKFMGAGTTLALLASDTYLHFKEGKTNTNLDGLWFSASLATTILLWKEHENKCGPPRQKRGHEFFTFQPNLKLSPVPIRTPPRRFDEFATFLALAGLLASAQTFVSAKLTAMQQAVTETLEEISAHEVAIPLVLLGALSIITMLYAPTLTSMNEATTAGTMTFMVPLSQQGEKIY